MGHFSNIVVADQLLNIDWLTSVRDILLSHTTVRAKTVVLRLLTANELIWKRNLSYGELKTFVNVTGSC